MFLCGRHTSEVLIAYTAASKSRHLFHVNINTERIAYSYGWLQNQPDPRGVKILVRLSNHHVLTQHL